MFAILSAKVPLNLPNGILAVGDDPIEPLSWFPDPLCRVGNLSHSTPSSWGAVTSLVALVSRRSSALQWIRGAALQIGTRENDVVVGRTNVYVVFYLFS
ncbi:hypothetical protein PAXRUDRAFT_313938 [Paxillus rubicundulus Ve08.2h10]|uniref:Uncharacterized protein n=1 Tax=Paxillus rubicundulus Ve08.2h10 TaxID=930991 RepID=A0A0D0DZX6_9AGAM|nr:hypothetical protein PAXRUDRAFT_313938 [Paxillus rubicundulus Ve08.2h10]